MQGDAQKEWKARLSEVGKQRAQQAAAAPEEPGQEQSPTVLIAFRGWTDGRVDLITPTPMHPADAVRVALHVIAKWSQEQEVQS